MTSFETLIGEHDMLDRYCIDIERALAAGATEDAIIDRDALSAALDEHLAHEDSEVYPMLIGCQDLHTAETAHRFNAAFESLADHWHDYLNRWPRAAALAAPEAFAVETAGIIEVLRKRIADENALLYPVALRASAISLRD